jgi:hypothetical protein
MSRGPGRWQRAILDELQRREVFYVREVLPATHTRSDRLALIRAAHQLARQGRLVVDVERQHWKRAALGAVVVARPGVAIDRLTLAALYRLRDELSDGSWDHDLLSLSRSSPGLWAAYREEEAATRALKAARQQTKAARQKTAQLALEETVARGVYEALRQHAEEELREKWRRESEVALKAFEGLRTILEPAWPERPTAKLGALASLIKLLAREGALTETLLVEQAQERLGWPEALAESVLAELKAAGHYQRLIDEASS